MNRKSIRLRNRSGNFPCDICGEYHILEEHHINGRKIEKPNHVSNLTNICSNCHTKVHYGLIVIEQWVGSTTGKELLWHEPDGDTLIGDSNTHIILYK